MLIILFLTTDFKNYWFVQQEFAGVAICFIYVFVYFVVKFYYLKNF